METLRRLLGLEQQAQPQELLESQQRPGEIQEELELELELELALRQPEVPRRGLLVPLERQLEAELQVLPGPLQAPVLEPSLG